VVKPVIGQPIRRSIVPSGGSSHITSQRASCREQRPYLLVDGTLDECIRQFEIHTAPQPPLVGAVLSEEHIVEARAAAGFSLIWICPARSRLSALPVRLSRARIHWCRRPGCIQHSLRDYNDKGVQNIAEGKAREVEAGRLPTEAALLHPGAIWTYLGY
jgi:hypothetical protein